MTTEQAIRAGRSIQETAEFLGVHANHVRNLLARKALRATHIGRRIIVLNAELDRFLAQHTESATAVDAR